MCRLDSNRIPPALVSLLPMAEKWGIGDDCERELAVSKASFEELESLIHCIDEVRDDDLYGWLSGPDSHSPEPSEEYLAFTTLTMAIDSAKLKLRKLHG